MFRKNELQRDIEATLAAPKSKDLLLSAKREHGLQFMIDAREDQSLAEVSNVFHGFSEHFEVAPLFPSPPFQAPGPDQEPTWGDTIFVATVYNVAFDDVTASPWDIAHTLRIEGGFLRVIPEVPIAIPEVPPGAELATQSAPKGWEHEAMRIQKAWEEIQRRGRKPGTNVHIGHPDTGWVDHEVWEKGNLDKNRSRNFMPDEPEKDARDPLTGPFPGHGNSTASVMVSPPGGELVGVAPHSIVIPIRCVSTVILYPGQPNVMRAVRHAMEKGCRVISLSLGGSAYPFLGVQLVHAAHANIIVVAASGNKTLFTVEPANYREVIGVGGTKYGDLEWEHSAWFPAGTVDISAPAVGVRKAAYSGYRAYDISEGTSYATAFMAGVAALWLSCHFHDRYEGTRYAYETFRDHVRLTARKVPGVGPGLFGIVDAEALMTTDPEPNAKEMIPEEASDFTGVAEVARLLGSENLQPVTSLLASTLLGQPAAPSVDAFVTLKAWVDEVVFILRGNPALRMELSREVASSNISAQTLRALLTPAASDALRQEFIAAETAEGATGDGVK